MALRVNACDAALVETPRTQIRCFVRHILSAGAAAKYSNVRRSTSSATFVETLLAPRAPILTELAKPRTRYLTTSARLGQFCAQLDHNWPLSAKLGRTRAHIGGCWSRNWQMSATFGQERSHTRPTWANLGGRHTVDCWPEHLGETWRTLGRISGVRAIWGQLRRSPESPGVSGDSSLSSVGHGDRPWPADISISRNLARAWALKFLTWTGPCGNGPVSWWRFLAELS